MPSTEVGSEAPASLRDVSSPGAMAWKYFVFPIAFFVVLDLAAFNLVVNSFANQAASGAATIDSFTQRQRADSVHIDVLHESIKQLEEARLRQAVVDSLILRGLSDANSHLKRLDSTVALPKAAKH